MNLLHEPWMPVRLSDGRREWVAPTRLSDPAVVAFDADRADFNGALAQFAVGLLQTCSLAQRGLQWKRLFENPPDEAELQKWFDPHVSAFVLDGDGARFMQDFELRASDGSPTVISSLLIESPGENAVKNNSDHFVKREHVQRLCPHCTAAALFTLQTNAPAGGAGIRTSLRGGGPLTTLLIAESASGALRPLWYTLWLNVLDRAGIRQVGGNDELDVPCFTFPWMAPMDRIQRADGETAPSQVHPLHHFWGMPRRIRLDFNAPLVGHCDVCGRLSDRCVQQYVSRPHGFNYKGAWKHPLSQYCSIRDLRRKIVAPIRGGARWPGRRHHWGVGHV